jgi:hypothetical protein
MNLDKEIEYIKDEKLKESAYTLEHMLPPYFFKIPASSTGKYHPEFATGDGGLLRHVKVATRIAYELLNLEMFKDKYSSEERDLLLYSVIFHDGLKLGLNESKYTAFDHPLIMAKFIRDNNDKLKLNDNQIDIITSSIASHMGEWTKDYNGNEVLPKPITKYQKFVHMCDYLASRKLFDVKFDSLGNIEGNE